MALKAASQHVSEDPADELGSRRTGMTAEELIRGQTTSPVSSTLIVSILLLLIGVLAMVSMTFNVGPFV